MGGETKDTPVNPLAEPLVKEPVTVPEEKEVSLAPAIDEGN